MHLVTTHHVLETLYLFSGWNRGYKTHSHQFNDRELTLLMELKLQQKSLEFSCCHEDGRMEMNELEMMQSDPTRAGMYSSARLHNSFKCATVAIFSLRSSSKCVHSLFFHNFFNYRLDYCQLHLITGMYIIWIPAIGYIAQVEWPKKLVKYCNIFLFIIFWCMLNGGLKLLYF